MSSEIHPARHSRDNGSDQKRNPLKIQGVSRVTPEGLEPTFSGFTFPKDSTALAKLRSLSGAVCCPYVTVLNHPVPSESAVLRDKYATWLPRILNCKACFVIDQIEFLINL